MSKYYTLNEAAELLGKSKETLRRWDRVGKLNAAREPLSNYRVYRKTEIHTLFEGFVPDESEAGQSPNKVAPKGSYSAIELFAGAGGLAIGMERAGIHCKALNEIDKWACQTLRNNRPNWQVLEGDVKTYSFEEYRHQVEVVTGGFPCQAFSYAGKKLGLEDARGTLFYEFARVVQEVQPLICVGENVRGLLSHAGGTTLAGMVSILDEIGYRVVPVQVLRAVDYRVPQKRERLFLVGVRKDIPTTFEYPKPIKRLFTLRDALCKGELYETDVPASAGVQYPASKKEILEQIPPYGYWRDLPVPLQKAYMGKSFYLGGGKTGMARRIGWEEPCLTLTCSPAQKQTERCHPEETRPFTVREYARIQTFPDEWQFAGSVAQQYKQIGNAVPVNLGEEMGYALIQFLNSSYSSSKP